METDGTYTGRYRFTGREWDGANQFQFHRGRYYDPLSGRWTSQDPLGFEAGDANLYRYVHNSPTNRTDADGLADRALTPPDRPDTPDSEEKSGPARQWAARLMFQGLTNSPIAKLAAWGQKGLDLVLQGLSMEGVRARLDPLPALPKGESGDDGWWNVGWAAGMVLASPIAMPAATINLGVIQWETSQLNTQVNALAVNQGKPPRPREDVVQAAAQNVFQVSTVEESVASAQGVFQSIGEFWMRKGGLRPDGIERGRAGQVAFRGKGDAYWQGYQKVGQLYGVATDLALIWGAFSSLASAPAAAGGAESGALVLQGDGTLALAAEGSGSLSAAELWALVKGGGQTSLGIEGFNDLKDNIQQMSAPEDGGGGDVPEIEGKPAAEKPVPERQKGDRMKSGDDVLKQLKEIQEAQQKVRQGKSKQIIDSIEKSKQRAKNKLKQIRRLEDLEDLEGGNR